MLKSMTAFGSSSIEAPFGRITAEIQSINRKFLEVNVLLPKEWMSFDPQIRKWVSELIGRGNVVIKFNVNFNENLDVDIRPNISLALKMQKAVDEIAKALNLPTSNELLIKLLSEESSLLQITELKDDDKTYLEFLKKVFDSAYFSFNQMKAEEGAAVARNIVEKLENLKKCLSTIKQYAPNATLRYRDRLNERLKEFIKGSLEDEERILKEIALFAERIDISEEITLFEAHLNKFFELIANNTGSIAKTLEFLLQELNREANTIGSKSSEMEIANCVIMIKSDLEKIREIIQNVE